MSGQRKLGWIVAAAGVLALGACDNGGDVRAWSPSDHDNNKNAAGAQVSGVAAPGQEDATLIDVTWRQNCARCHGPSGRGDGPEGRMLRVPDLSRPAFQEKVGDEAIANIIRKGRNKMPAFETLPPKVVDGLVKRIREWRR